MLSRMILSLTMLIYVKLIRVLFIEQLNKSYVSNLYIHIFFNQLYWFIIIVLTMHTHVLYCNTMKA